MRSFNFLVHRFIPLLFLPSELVLLFQVATSATLAERLLALSLALFCPELVYMAQVDLENAAAVAAPATSPEKEDSRLSHFCRIVVSTVVLESTGFYAALFSLQGGAIIIIFSQIWFNLLAGIQLFPNEALKIVPFGIAERQAVLAANALGLGLLCLWFVEAAQVWLAAGLLGLTVLFLTTKYDIIKSAQAILSGRF